MSNRLTFSLASLIVLILFGATSVMAHPPGINSGAGELGNLQQHGHPTNRIPAIGTGLGKEEVPTHDTHPKVSSVDARPSANPAVGTKAYQNRKVVLLTNVTGVVIPLDPIPTEDPGLVSLR